MSGTKQRVANPALWVPTSYLSEGIPFAMAIWVTGSMFSSLGHSDSEVALVTGSIGIAWSLKPLPGPATTMTGPWTDLIASCCFGLTSVRNDIEQR